MAHFHIVHLSMWILVAMSRAYGRPIGLGIENILLTSIDLTFVLTWNSVSLSKNDSESEAIYNVGARITHGSDAKTQYIDETSFTILEFNPPGSDKMYMHTWKFMMNANVDSKLITKDDSRKYDGLDSAVQHGSLAPPHANMTHEYDSVTVTLETQNDEIKWYDWFFQFRYFNDTSPSKWMAAIEPISNMAQINLTIPTTVANFCIEARFQMLFDTGSNIVKICAIRQCSSTTAYSGINFTDTVAELGYDNYKLIIISSAAFIVTVFLSLCLIKKCLRDQLKSANKDLPEAMKRIIDATSENDIYNDDGQHEESVLEMELSEEPPSTIIYHEDEPLLLSYTKSEVSPEKQMIDESESYSSKTVNEVVTPDSWSTDDTSSTDMSETVTDLMDNNNSLSPQPTNTAKSISCMIRESMTVNQ